MTPRRSPAPRYKRRRLIVRQKCAACPCLVCTLWRTIRDHASENASSLDGKAVCDRRGVMQALTLTLRDAVRSEPDRHRRVGFVDEISAVLRDGALRPGCEQPRDDMEVVSWQ